MSSTGADRRRETSGRILPDCDDWPRLREEYRAARAEDPRPNILVLITDQHQANALSCAGNRWVHTPNLDALALEGVRFTRAHCSTPVCGPSRASLLTSRLPSELNMPFNDYDPDPTVPNVGQLLRESGYETTWIGKWHVSDTYVDTPDGIPGFVNVALPAGLPDIRMGDVTDFIHATDAVQYLEQHASLSPQPWLCFVSLQNPHDICFFDDLADKPYLNAEYLPPLPANFGVNPDEPDSLQGRRLHQPRLRGPADLPFWRPMTRDWTEIQWRAYAQTYYQMTQSVDRAIGMVLDALEAGGWADDTLVVMTADHGEGLGSHRWYTKGALYEESVCVPLIVRPPKRDRLAPRVEGALVSGLDLAPTLLDYAGLGPPPLSRGRSLRALIETQRGLVRECIPAELVLYGDNDEHIGRMIRSERFKYNAYLVGERREELYDLAEDPGETTNLARRPEFRAELERHRAVLRDWLAVVGDAFPVPEE